MARYLDPKNDLTFKRIFGEHPDLLISFLNALMPFENGQLIEEVEYLPAEQVPDNPVRKNSIVDVKCKDNLGRQFIVEMQMFWSETFKNRIVFNASKAYVRQLDKNESYKLLEPVYALSILNENYDHKTAEFYHHYQIVNKENTDEVIVGLEFVFVELIKFKPENWADRKMAVLWLRFLKEVGESTESIPKELMANDQIRKAAELCEEGAFTLEELAAYEAYWDYIRTEKGIRDAALQEGETVGLKKGEVIGLKKGETKALERVVIDSKHNGFSVEQIQLITRLSIETITGILKRRGLL